MRRKTSYADNANKKIETPILNAVAADCLIDKSLSTIHSTATRRC